jgi:3-hydroxyacyl-CoA dehydrogenase
MGEIRRVAVVGSGLMGSGIAEVCARADLDVLVGEVTQDAARAAGGGVRHCRTRQDRCPQPGPSRGRGQRSAYPVPTGRDPDARIRIPLCAGHRHRHGARLRSPDGPLRLADLIGLDTVAAIAGSMHEEFKEPEYAAAPLLLRMVDAEYLGRKTGRGFYDYTEGGESRSAR